MMKQVVSLLQLRRRKLEYEVIVPGDGTGITLHCNLANTRSSLEKIGITLKINDPSDANVLWDAIDANTHEMWAAAWQSTIDPDMYQFTTVAMLLEEVVPIVTIIILLTRTDKLI